MKKIFTLLTLVILLAGCNHIKPADQNNNKIGLANPASVYCEEQGGRVDIRDTEGGPARNASRSDAGGQVGWCVFEDDSECEEWAFYRGECEPENVKNEFQKVLDENNLLECVVGRTEDGQNQIEFNNKTEGCPSIDTEEKLMKFCGKDTARVCDCGNCVRLDSTNPDAGPLFFEDNQILSCPNSDDNPMSTDCVEAIAKTCEIEVRCD